MSDIVCLCKTTAAGSPARSTRKQFLTHSSIINQLYVLTELLCFSADVCVGPAEVEHAVRDPPRRRFRCNETVTYVCDVGYGARGEATLRCGEDGFRPGPPSCVRGEERRGGGRGGAASGVSRGVGSARV